MKRTIFNLLMIAILASSCTNFNTVRIKKTNFDEEVQRAQNLVFTFNKELLADTSFLNKWDTTVYMRFEPGIQGKFMWTAKNELTFSPSGQMSPSTNYKATLLPALLGKIKKNYKLESDPFLFHTPYLDVTSINTFWALSDDPAAKVEARLQLSFNNPVLPVKLQPHATIQVEGKTIPYSILTTSESETIEIALRPENGDFAENAEGKLSISVGMPSSGGNALTQKIITHSFNIPSKDQLSISSVETGFDVGKGIISVFTTQPVIEEGLAGAVSVDPAVEFTVSTLSGGFLIKGNFHENQAYTLRIGPSLKSVFGKTLDEEFVETVAFGAIEPFVGFMDENAMYLSSRGYRNLAISIINVPVIKVSVFKIFENNIQHYMRQGKNWDYVYDNDEYYDMYGYSFDENYGKPVMTKVVQTRSLPKNGNISLLNLDLDELQFSDPFKGVFLVKVESTDRRWLQDVQLLSLSDLGMIVKQGSEQVMVFVNSLKDASPVKSAKVDFISTNNQKIFTAITDNYGVAVMKNKDQLAAGFQLGMVSVRKESDFNFILLNNSRVETSRFEVGGKSVNALEYDVFIYGDRNLYRPGDSVNMNVLVRTLRWETVKNIPIKIKLINPGGKEFISLKKQLSENGSAASSFYIPPQAMTGTYLIEVYSANNILLESRRISVEEFVPDRIKVSVKLDKQVYNPAEKIKVSTLAENLFGTVASGKKVETELRLMRKQLQPKAFPQYNFGITTQNLPVLTSLVQETVTDQSGKAEQEIIVPTVENIGILEGSIFSTVFDETGRPVNRLNIVTIPTQGLFFGIKEQDRWVNTRKPLNFSFVAVDKEGKAVKSAKAAITIIYSRYETVIERGYNRYNYVSQRKETVVFSKEMNFAGNGLNLPFVPGRSGEYEVRIAIPGSVNYVSHSFYAYGWGDTDFSSFEVDRDGEITITCDKQNYKPGDKAKLLFKAPFDGQMLVTYEQNNVLEYKYIELKNKSASLDISVSKAHLPNIYIDATAFRKTLDEFMPLTVAHGVISLKVDDPDLKLKVGIKAAEKSRSGVRQIITLNTIPNAEVTIAVVDEGILQVTDFKTPDPYAWFYQKRALGVSSFDLYALLIPEMRSSSSVAGGEAFDLSRRINPLTNERVKLISKWSGILKANHSGQVSFPIDIPQFSGALRVMAVAYKDNKFGVAEHMMKVADPVVISMALPRFLSPGDKVKMSASLTNTTASGGNAEVQIQTSGPLSVVSSKSSKLYLKAGKEETVDFEIQALANSGNATVTLKVKALGQSFSQEIVLPVRPAGGLTFSTGSGAVKAGSTGTFKTGGELIPSSVQSSLYITRSPVGRFLTNLNQLLRYPYGCLEQTVSVAFPQLYFKDFVQYMGTAKNDDSFHNYNSDHNVQQAILKIESMQLYNGGFSLWENGGVADWWPSAYAIHFLMEAQKAGFDVNRKVVEGGLGFLEQKVKEKEMNTWFYYENNVLKSRKVPRQEIFYSLYVLAIADRPSVSVMNFYKSQANQLSPESRYLLASSFLLAGDRKSYQSTLPRAFGAERAEPASSGYYGSYLRDLAISLNAILEADPENPQVGELMGQIVEEAKRPNHYYTTQENAFALLAVGKQVRKAMNSNINASIKINGKPIGSFNNKDIRFKDDLLNKTVSIAASGSGMLYYSYELSGISTVVPKGAKDNYIKVRKRYLDRNGREVSQGRFKQNELVVVEISAQAITGKSIENVAITDLLPACFEIENSRLVAEREFSWIKSKDQADYVDIRDDRISYFTGLNSEIKYFYYTVRVVGKGQFTVGPVTADAMYNASYNSFSGSQVFLVE